MPRNPRHPEDFDLIYASSTPAWEIGRPQPAFADLLSAGLLAGRLPVVGCGAGEHVLWAASAGGDATGVDLAVPARNAARAKARARGLAARFLECSVLDLVSLHENPGHARQQTGP